MRIYYKSLCLPAYIIPRFQYLNKLEINEPILINKINSAIHFNHYEVEHSNG